MARVAYLFISLCASLAFGQSLSLSSGSGAAGTVVSLSLTLTSPSGSSPAAVQWTFNYQAANVTAFTVAPGSALIAAGKSIQCSGGAAAYKCIASAINNSTIGNGIVAQVSVTLAAGTVSPVSIGITSSIGAAADGSAMAVTASGGTVTPITAVTGTASFVKVDNTSAGTWKGVYGADGFNVINDTVSYPSYVAVTPSGNLSYTWAASTAATSALQKPSSSTDRIAACWYNSGSFTIDLAFNDTNTHQVAVYLLDWDTTNGRSERVDILDGNGNVLDSRSASVFTPGEYLVWNLSGHVVMRFTNTSAYQAVVSGIFFGAAGGTPAPASGTAAFLKTDTTTAGTWKGVYGADGFNVINDTVSYPSYVAVTPSGNLSYTWAASTASTSALQKASSTTDRIAACWYNSGFFTIDLAFKDTNMHQVAVYLLDWDTTNGRSERVDILDGNGNVLDSRSASVFTAGEYLAWNLSGHVVMRFTNTSSYQAVVSGIFFGAAGATTPPASGTAAFLKTDTTTAGTWKGVYGADGFNVINDTVSYPPYVAVTPSGNLSYVWAGSTTAISALQKASSSTDRIAACWYNSGAFTIDLAFKDTNTHQVAVYLLDWDTTNGRSERVDILDGNGNVLDSRPASVFTYGEYLVWNLSGHVVIRFTNTSAYQAVVSGIFFGAAGTTTPPASGTAAFLKTDTTTAGTWKGVYGADGYNVINDTVNYPSYVAVTPSGNLSYIWAGSTAATSALQKASSSTDRIAACWYNSGSFTIDLAFKDTNTHQVAVYLLDWDTTNGRSERVDILDGNGNVLDSRSASVFTPGEYLVWNLSGHVVMRFTNTSAYQAVVSGIFFR